MYNSLSNIQKHLYSLIQQNNPEYLQQSTRQNIKEATETRERPVNYAKPEKGEKLAAKQALQHLLIIPNDNDDEELPQNSPLINFPNKVKIL